MLQLLTVRAEISELRMAQRQKTELQITRLGVRFLLPLLNLSARVNNVKTVSLTINELKLSQTFLLIKYSV